MRKTRNIIVTTALTVALIGGAAGGAAAAPDRGDGPKTDEEQALQDACQLAYNTMEWAKIHRRAPGDVWDRIANAAFWFIDNHCDDVDIQTVHRPGPMPADLTAANAQLIESHRIVGIEPFDNPIWWYSVVDVEPFDNPIGV